jgi:hypothetical protein
MDIAVLFVNLAEENFCYPVNTDHQPPGVAAITIP